MGLLEGGMREPMQVEGIRVACFDFAGGGLPVEAVDEIRLFVPLGKQDGFDAVSEPPGRERQESLVQWPEVWIVPPGSPCGIECRSTARVALMALDPQFCERTARAAGSDAVEVVDTFVAYDSFLRGSASVVGAAYRIGRPPDAAYLSSMARGLAEHVVARYGRPAKRARCGGLSPERVERAVRMIEENISTPIHVDEIAAELGLSPFHFARMFKQSTGYSPHFFLTLKRMDRAKELLAGTTLPLAEVAHRLGYSTQAHFTGVFRAYSGTTPRAYRVRYSPDAGIR